MQTNVAPANNASSNGNHYATAPTSDAHSAAYTKNLRPHFEAVDKYGQACYFTYM